MAPLLRQPFSLLISIYKVLTRTCTQLYLVAKSRQCVDIAQFNETAIRFVFTTRRQPFAVIVDEHCRIALK